jgi:Protein kinase domain.
MCHWAEVDHEVSAEAVERLYAAPEVNGVFHLTPAVDWWSFGALTFELLTGKVGKCNNTQLHAKWPHTGSGKYNFCSALEVHCLFDGECHSHVDGLFLYVHGMKVNKVDFFFLVSVSS